jgi:hypothetical protein
VTLWLFVCDIKYVLPRNLWHPSESGDYVLSAMTEKIKTKYNKYWGDLDRVNLMLFVVVVLDPRTKLDSLDYWFKEVLSVEQVPLGQII